MVFIHYICRIICIFAVILATALLPSCSQGDISAGKEGSGEVIPISFSSASAASSRATNSALSQYIDNFSVYGAVNNDGTYESVFNNYKVTYTANSANTTSSNTTGWDYVTDDQSIKYWDNSCSQYLFWAIAPYRGGLFSPGSDGKIASATISLTDADLNTKDANGYYSNCLFYTDPKIVQKADYGKTVTLPFRSACSRIRFAIYETVPGYVVKSVTFNGNTETSFTIAGSFNSKGTISLAYDNDNIKTTATMTGTATVLSKSFGTLNYVLKPSVTEPENQLTSGDYLGTMSSNPSFAGSVDTPGYYTYILPYTDNSTPLVLNITYTLLSTDGGGQEITKTTSATVPADYCHWQPNYSYTYLFKITNSNLTPITLAGWCATDNTDDNRIGTITPLDSYSITTHQDDDVEDTGIEYVKGSQIDVTVINNNGNGTPKKVTLDGTTDYVMIYHQATSHEWYVEDLPAGYNGTVTKQADSSYTDSSHSTPGSGVYTETWTYSDGKAVFVPDESGTYRVEYWHKDDGKDARKLAVKIVKIKGDDVPIDNYPKWQSGSSQTASW